MRLGADNVAKADVMYAVWLLVAIVRARSFRWLFRIRSLGLLRPFLVASAESVQSVLSSFRSLPYLLLPRSWSVAFLADFFVFLFVRFSSALLIWSVRSSILYPVSEISPLVASVARSFRNPSCVPTMSDNVDDVTPVSPSPSAPMSGVTAAAASSVQPIAPSADPTMAVLFDIVNARSSAPLDPPPCPVSTPSGYVSFTGTVSR